MFFRFPEDARWDSDRGCVAFGITIGEYEGVVRVYRRAFQSLLNESPTPESCLEAYYLHRTRLDRIAERKIRHRPLTDDEHVPYSSSRCRTDSARPDEDRSSGRWPRQPTPSDDRVARCELWSWLLGD